ncbi:MAG: A/G-specific adenine glycosylase [Patescibacteria group bacterium UBA2163]
MKLSGQNLNKFTRTVLDFYHKEGRRHLPWRTTKNPFRIFVSEVMLQQTQVDRVIPYYKDFLKRFSTPNTLAEASLGDVLRVWSGLGYNRRAKMMHQAAQVVRREYAGRMPRSYEELLALPGVGDYTAKAVRVFAYNEPEFMIETNIRAVFLHHFFPNVEAVEDTDIMEYMARVGIPDEPRIWYAALMDYGSYLKKSHINPSRKSKRHITQKPFKGSSREVRGALIRAVSEHPQTQKELHTLPFNKEKIDVQIAALCDEGMLVYYRRRYGLPE